MRLVVVVLLSIGVILSVVLYKAYHAMPTRELRRQARSGRNRHAQRFYKAVAYGSSLEALLWLIGSSLSAALILMLVNTRWWLGVVAIFILGWLALFWEPPRRSSGPLWYTAAVLAVPIAGLLSVLQPVLGRLGDLLRFLAPEHPHTGLYEKEDLLELLSAQGRQLDSQLSELDLKVAHGALTFGDKSVRSVMTPRRLVKFVAADESIGPTVMDELHKSGFSRFPVIKGSPKMAELEIVGTLYFRDLIGHENEGKIRSVMEDRVYFINEDQNLSEALSAFLQTRHHLLIVVNNFEEVVGVLSIEDVLAQIVGKPIVDDFENYHNKHVVAGIHTEKEAVKQSAAKVVK